MSAQTFVAFYGLRFLVLPHELDGLEARIDPRQIAARKAGLSTYWGNFGGENDRYVLLIGTRIAVLGQENEPASALPSEELREIMSNTTEKLEFGSLAGDVGLYLEWQVDV